MCRAESIDTFDFLTWLHLHDCNGVDWRAGGIILGAALLGAFLTLFFHSPSELPALGGADECRYLSSTLKKLEEIQTCALVANRENDSQLEQRRAYLDHLNRRLRVSRRALWIRATSIFVIVGPATAATVATSAWQAVLIGATGPAIWKAIANRNNTVAVIAEADTTIRDLVRDVEGLVRDRGDLTSERERQEDRAQYLRAQVSECKEQLEASLVALEELARPGLINP